MTKTLQKNLRKFIVFMVKSETSFESFRSGGTSLRDEPRPERSTAFNQDDFIELVECNLHKSTRELEFDVSISAATKKV